MTRSRENSPSAILSRLRKVIEIELRVTKKAVNDLMQGRIGHIKQTDDDLIGRRVICLNGIVSKDIVLVIRSINWKKGTAVVYGGKKYGKKIIPADQLRRIDAISNAIKVALKIFNQK